MTPFLRILEFHGEFWRIFSSNINEVIRTILNFLFFFFYEKILHAQKAQKEHKAQKASKSTKKHKNTTKQKHEMQINNKKCA